MSREGRLQPEHFLGPLARRPFLLVAEARTDVAGVHDDAPHRRVGEPVGADGLEVDPRPVGVAPAEGDGDGPPWGLSGDGERRTDGLGVVGVDVLEGRAPHEVLGCVAEHAERGRGLVRDAALRVQDRNDIGRVVDEVPEPLLLERERGLGLLPLGDVLDDRDEMGDIPFGRPDGRHRERGPDD